MSDLHLDPRQNQFNVLQERWGFAMFLGILLIVLGTLAIGAAVLTTMLSIFILGGIVLAAGIFQVCHAFTSKSWGGFSAEFLVGILYIVVGGLLIARPVQSAESLTLLLAALFFVGGLFRIYAALVHRPSEWGWLFLSGVISLVLGGLIWAQWPESGLWVIGAFIGIDILFTGWTLLMLGFLGKRVGNK